jgi:hypothetical protein
MKFVFNPLFFLTVFIFGCSENNQVPEQKDRLPTNLVNNPRSAAGTDSVALQALATMDFTDTLHDFGIIREGEVVSYDFEFTNNGKKPLVISSANGSCGCTVPEYPGSPLEPGKTSFIKVRFHSAGRSGHQEKSVSLTTNSVRGTHRLYIKAEVQK